MKKILFALLILMPVKLFTDGSVIVLCYHSFLDKNYFTDFSRNSFENQLKTIESLGYRFVSWDDIVSNRISGDKNVLVTIDDGNVSVRPAYAEVMKPMGIKPMLFIYPAITSRMSYSLKWEDLTSYAREGVTIGGHGFYHLYINQKLFDTNRKEFMTEIYRSKSRLDERMGQPVKTFAYPFGSFSPVTYEHLKKAGYEYSFSLREAALQVPLSREANPYDLPRYMATKSSIHGILAMLKNGRTHLAQKTGKKKA